MRAAFVITLLSSLGLGCSAMGPIQGIRWSASNNSEKVINSCSANGESEAETVSIGESKLVVGGGYIGHFDLMGPPLLPLFPLNFDEALCRLGFEVTIEPGDSPVNVDFSKWEIRGRDIKLKPCRVGPREGREDTFAINSPGGQPKKVTVSFPFRGNELDSIAKGEAMKLVISGVDVGGNVSPDVELSIKSFVRGFRYCGLVFPGELCKPMGRSLSCEGR